jgi:hypothetical protein
MQYHFGTGTLWGAATMDALGNTIAVPTPIKFGTLSDTSIEFDRDIKELYGQNAFPVAAGGGKMKIAVKAKFAQISGRLFNDMFFGQGVTSGTQTAAVEDLTGTAIPSTPFQITVTPPNSGTYLRDLGVLDSNGVAMVRVASAPTTGQYSIAGAIYTFAAVDVAKVVYISYAYTYALATSKVLTINNLAMGTLPVFGIDLSCRFQGKNAYFRLGQCAAKKLGFDPKQDDYAMSDLDISCFADPVTGSIGSLVFTE